MNPSNPYGYPPGYVPQAPEAPAPGYGYPPGYVPQAPAAPAPGAHPGYAPPPMAPPGFAPPGQAPPPPAPLPPYGPPGYAQPPGYPAPVPGAPPGYGPPQGYQAPPSALVDPSALAGLNGAQMYESGNYFPCETAEADCRVVDVILKNSQKNGAVLILELETLQSTSTNNPPGSKHGVVFKLANRQVAFPQLLECAGAILGYDKSIPEHFQAINTKLSGMLEQIWNEASKAKTFNGKLVHVSTFPHQTKGNKVTITAIKYSKVKQPA